jgi:tetratricopeptide (TPR) repeat protein
MKDHLQSRSIPIVIIALLAIALYLTFLNNSFHFDDLTNIVENRYIRDLTDIPLLLKGLEVRGSWFRALPTLSFAINYYFHELNVVGYHLVNLILHILSGILVYFISRNLFTLALKNIGSSLGHHANSAQGEINLFSLFSALIFVAHPIQVNTVTYIVERNEGLAGFFYLLCFFLFIKGSLEKGTKKALLLSGAGFSFLCSIFSKEIGFTLPVVLVLYDLLFVCKKKEDVVKRLKIYLPLLLLLIAFVLFFLHGGIVRLLVKETKRLPWTPWESVLTQANVIIQYFKLLLLPLPGWLNVDHDFQVSKLLFEYPTIVSVSVILLLFILASILIKKSRLVSFSILFFFVVLAPTSSVLPILDIMVEYRLYLPVFSYALMIALGLYYLYILISRRFSNQVAKGIAGGISILLLLSYSVVTIERNRVFKNELTLWNDAARKSPNKIRTTINLVGAYYSLHLYDQAISTSLEVLKKDPRNSEFYTKLGVFYMLRGEYDQAKEKFERSIEIKRFNPKAHNNLGVIYLQTNEPDRAVEEFKQALSYHSDYAEAHNNLAKALATKGFLDEAIKEEKEAIRIDPFTAEFHFNLARFYENRGLLNEAVGPYQESVKLDRKFFEAHYHLGEIYTKIGNYSGAISEFEEALKIKPNSGKAYFMLGVNFIRTRDKRKAISNLEKALQFASSEKDRSGIESTLGKLRSLP